jgi:hypothetical protein
MKKPIIVMFENQDKLRRFIEGPQRCSETVTDVDGLDVTVEDFDFPGAGCLAGDLLIDPTSGKGSAITAFSQSGAEPEPGDPYDTVTLAADAEVAEGHVVRVNRPPIAFADMVWVSVEHPFYVLYYQDDGIEIVEPEE